MFSQISYPTAPFPPLENEYREAASLSEFRYLPKDTTSRCDTLDVQLYATFDKPYDAELELNVTSKKVTYSGA